MTREELDERQPRSAPDALRWEPGVYVQQTAAAQGSAYLRGRTGQQTLLLFDGVRLNNSLSAGGETEEQERGEGDRSDHEDPPRQRRFRSRPRPANLVHLRRDDG